jgi:hypothetical protein
VRGDIPFVASTTLVFVETLDNTSGTLTVSDNAGLTAHITLLGQYVAANFHIQNDAVGGTLVTDPPVSSMTDPSPLTLVQHA